VAVEEHPSLRETTARLRYVATSPPKIRQVLELIQGQDVETARDTLRFCERSAAHDVGKLLNSAVANAEHNDNIPEEELFVARAHADDGPTQKRWRPRARGRGVRIRKRTSHVTLVVARFADDDLEHRRQADAASGRVRRRIPRRRTAEQAVEAGADVAADEEPLEDDGGPEDAETSAAAPPTPAKTAKKTTAKKTTAKKTPAKSTAKKTPAKKTTAKKTTATKAAGDAPAKKATAKKTTAKKAPAKRARKATKDED
jgi:large subunit ribosomal protein L22